MYAYIDTIRRHANFEFDPNIDKTRHLDKKSSNFLYNSTHFTASKLRLKHRFMPT